VRIVATLPRAVREVEHAWIPLSDGTRLAARMWLPADADAAPVPAILEYLPYRKRDFTRARDEPMHRWFAGHGYACVRVDVRGSGESDGLLEDEYAEVELADGTEVIAWIAGQPWCTGAVGLIGKSWGGFNALQLAARRPPALGAVITVCASDDRYADDAHYMGGCLLNENLTWGASLVTFGALPPDPALVGEGWRETWRRRLEALVLFPERWLRHPRRDEYWRRGSVGEDLSAITCPVYAVGGWADAYTNAVPRLLAGLRVPRKGLVGPWSHNYPHNGVPGPAIGFLQEALRWWDRWLRGADTGVMDEPMYRVWMQDPVAPGAAPEERPGRWVAEPSWPSPRLATRCWAMNAGRLESAAGAPQPLTWRSPQTVGLASGEWCSFGLDDLPGDQREDDAASLSFDSAPLDTRLEILGAPEVVLQVQADRPRAFVAVRLNEVLPDGASARVSYGLLDLTQRAGDDAGAPLVPGRSYTVRVRLNDVAHAFAAGSRLRVAVSSSYWPIAWPAPEPVTLVVTAGVSRLELPVRPARDEDARLAPFAPPETAPGVRHTRLRAARVERTIARDPATGEVECRIVREEGGFGDAGYGRLEDIGLEVGLSTTRRFRIHPDDPAGARAEVAQDAVLARGEWRVRVETRASLVAGPEHFELRARVAATESGSVVVRRSWAVRVPRDPK
jgi:hypothetical protein